MITVVPTEFVKVEYDADRIAALSAETVAAVPGVPDDLDIELRIAEDEATSRMAIVSLDPVVFALDGGAIEDYRDPRRLGAPETKITITRLLLELLDRRDPAFGAPALDADVSQAHAQAWDVNLYGRVARLGHRLHPPRFRYNFRNRHGFTDAADRAFDQLWAADGLDWARIVAFSDDAGRVRGVTASAGHAVSCIETPSKRSMSGGRVSRPSQARAIATISSESKCAR